MSFNKTSSKGADFKPLVLPETGLQAARSYAIIGVGSHLSVFNGQPVINKKTGKQVTTSKIHIYWEIPKFMNTREDGGKSFPANVWAEYTWSASEKSKLPDVLKAWGPMKNRPEELTLELIKKFLGHPCMINVEHSIGKDKKTGKDRTYANVGSKGRGINPFMKEIPQPVKCNDPIFFNLDNFTWDSFKNLPPYSQGVIRKSIEFAQIIAKNPEPLNPDSEAELSDTEIGDFDAGGITVEQQGEGDQF